ncbi:TorD/DmsD family molecular chaperone [Robertmurraya andreesenii]|uniref:TorA maturation chaperone TorD n=1 Tax=Anoxybacillus andreesenii TaxID=1325932 RepID=A0ABT9V3A2_9BACL|nr:molecular chaperone TorD family protein [Robertmurraya andreesenii]MDQ0155412.1 TorA maturation chaperone TorD [Robertmurraya andreesenii]
MRAQIALQEIADLLFAREYAYDILRRFFIEEPSQEYIKIFRLQNMAEMFPFKEDSQEIQNGINEIKEYFERFDVVHNQSHFDDLHWDYTRMMVGPFELPAPPWESVYVQKEPILFQQCTIDVRNKYKHFGFEIAERHVEADDHIGLELDFLYHLNKLCLQSIEEGNIKEVTYLLAEQKQFMDNHLLVFVPEFSKKIIENADTQFYKGMAKVLNYYLQMDSQVLKELLNIEIIQ